MSRWALATPPRSPTTGRGVKTDDDEESDEGKAAKKGASPSTRRRGPDGRRGEATRSSSEFTEADLIARRDALNAASATRRAFDQPSHQGRRTRHAPCRRSVVQKGEPIEIEEPITVKTLSAALGVKGNDIISKLLQAGCLCHRQPGAGHRTAAMMALEYGVELTIALKPTLEEAAVARVRRHPRHQRRRECFRVRRW